MLFGLGVATVLACGGEDAWPRDPTKVEQALDVDLACIGIVEAGLSVARTVGGAKLSGVSTVFSQCATARRAPVWGVVVEAGGSIACFLSFSSSLKRFPTTCCRVGPVGKEEGVKDARRPSCKKEISFTLVLLSSFTLPTREKATLILVAPPLLLG